MEAADIEQAVSLAEKTGHVFASTCNAHGVPHIGVAGEMAAAGADRVVVRAWCCPGTTANLRETHRISLVVWDESMDNGYQLIGEVVDTADLPGDRSDSDDQDVERHLLIRVEEVMRFSHAPHSDAAV